MNAIVDRQAIEALAQSRGQSILQAITELQQGASLLNDGEATLRALTALKSQVIEETYKLARALDYVKALHIKYNYTAAQCVEFIRLAHGLSYEQADLVAKRFHSYRIDCAEAYLNPLS